MNCIPETGSCQNEETGDDEDIEIIRDDNVYKVRCAIPSSLFAHIIGSKGMVRKRIESETRTKVVVPRQNEKGDIGMYTELIQQFSRLSILNSL